MFRLAAAADLDQTNHATARTTEIIGEVDE